MECRTLEEWQKRTRTPEEYAHFTASEKFMDQIEFLDAQIADAKSDKP
jgi:hypothetical protein